MDIQSTWLTKDSFDRLKAELKYLSGPGRLKITKKIEIARSEGDLKENGGYHAAKEEQGKIEARINHLINLLENAKVGYSNFSVKNKSVDLGMVIVAMIAHKKQTFLLGNREIAKDCSINVFSDKSPLGIAILGLKKGESTYYKTPNGKKIFVKIISIEPFQE